MAPAKPLGADEDSRWSLKVTGSFAILDPDTHRDVTPRGRKARAMLAYLVARPGARIAKEKITELLWGDRGEAQARASLRQALLEIRRATMGGPELVGTDRGHIWLNWDAAEIIAPMPANGDTEFVAFEDLDHISPEFDEWLDLERSRHRRDASSQLRSEVERLLAEGRGSSAMDLIEAIRRFDPYDEDALRLALQAEYQAGRPAALEQRFQAMEMLLREDLGVEPSAETRALHDRLLADLNRRKEFATGPLEIPARPSVPTRDWSWRRFVAIGLILLAAIALLVGWSSQFAGAEQKRIAVLPFQALGGVEPVVAEGMSEAIRSELSRERGIQTIGRTSSLMFKNKAEDFRSVGRKLDADYIVEGSVRQTDAGLQAIVTLVDAKDASTLWSQRFVSRAGDIQRIESTASGALMTYLGLTPRVAETRADPRAYANYIQAKGLIRDRDWVKAREARDLLREAVKLDPGFAPAWAQLGGVLNFLGSNTSAVGRARDDSWQKEALAMARRSIAIDPNLAEGHAMLAFIHGFDTDEGRAHIRRAVTLNPNDPQTMYWSGLAAGYAGDFETNEKAIRRALELDPLWRRPIEVVAQWAIARGNRDEAYGYVERLRSADPSAAVEIEMSLAREEGDLSRVVQIGRRDPIVTSTSAAKLSLAWSLIELGYVQEGLLLAGASPFDRLVHQGRLPDRKAVLDHLRPYMGYSEELFMIQPVVIALIRAGRCDDVAAIYDQPASRMSQLANIKDGNREPRRALAGLVGWCMAKIGRANEARQLYRAADEANRVFLASPEKTPWDYVMTATNEAVMGRRQRALAQLEQGVANGWFAFEGLNLELGEAPWFASLRGDPRFERLRKIARARLLKERRETEALGVI